MRMNKFIAGSAAAVSALAFAAAAQAATWVATGTNEGNPVSASADVTFSGGLLTVDLTNTTVSMKASNQAISGIFLTFDNAPTAGDTFTQAGALVNLDGTTNTKTPVTGSPTRWDGAILSGAVVRLWTLTGTQPKNLISQNTADFSHLNNGIDNFNPYIDGVGHFTYKLTGPATKVTAVSFLYGTAATNPLISGSCTEGCGGGTVDTVVPEPSTWALMILGFGSAGAMLRRRKLAAA